MPKTLFTPQTDGFHFINSFENIVKLPLIGTIRTYGRCGGMSYTALDHYFAKLSMPRLATQDFAQSNGVPPDGHPLANYIYRRQIKSFMTPSALKFVLWSLYGDGPGSLNKGVSRLTKENEFKKLKSAIDRGVPVPLGLIMARNLKDFGKNHQVIAFDYEEDADSQTVHIYDVNYADRGMILRSRSDELSWQECDTKGNLLGIEWRGWFVQDYKRREIPPELRSAAMGAAAADATRSRTVQPDTTATRQTQPQDQTRLVNLTLTLNRVTFVNDEDEDAETEVALEFEVGGTMWRWPATDLKTVIDGQSYPLIKSFETKVAAGGVLQLNMRLAADSAVEPAGNSIASAFEAAAHGVIRDRHTAAQNWGIGEHVSRSTGAGIIYTVAYTITAA